MINNNFLNRRPPRPTNPIIVDQVGRRSPRGPTSNPTRYNKQNSNTNRNPRSATADERRVRGGSSRSPRRSPRKREAVSAGYFAPQTNVGRSQRGGQRGSGRNSKNGKSSNNPIKAEAALLPIEWRCRTPPKRHDEVSYPSTYLYTYRFALVVGVSNRVLYLMCDCVCVFFFGNVPKGPCGGATFSKSIGKCGSSGTFNSNS